MPSLEPRPLQILIAEDHDEFRRLLAEAFRAQGYGVTECRHGLELVGRLRCLQDESQPEEFDLIVSDIRMPAVTGLSVLAGLRHLANAPPVILITAFGDEETHAEAESLGAAAILDKPFEMADLMAKVEEVLTA